MQRKTKLIAAAAAGLLAAGGLAGLAQADRGGERGAGWGEGHGRGMMARELMERYDADRDGKVTQQEIDQNRAEWYGEFDADRNAALSLDEFRALWLKARNEMIVREFQFFDRDGNGQVTLEEYRLPMADIVARRDRNGDGALSPEDRGRRGEHRRLRQWQGGDGGTDGGMDDEEAPPAGGGQPPAQAPATP